MANLEFRFGAMNSGKSMSLLQMAYNFVENNKKVILIKPKIDTKGGDKVISRIGPSKKVDILLETNKSLFEIKKKELYKEVDVILVDEVQFLTENQVEELWYISKILDTTVVCFGIKMDFLSNLFPGSKRLLELSDKIIELTTICVCGKKARFNARTINDEYIFEGNQIEIDNQDDIKYVPLCGKCYIKKMLKKS